MSDRYVPNGFIPYLLGLNRAAGTIRNTALGWRRFLRHLEPLDLPFTAVTQPDLESYRERLLKQDRCAPSTINAYLLAIKRVYAWLAQNGHIPCDPSCRIRLSRVQNRIPSQILTRSEMYNLLDLPHRNTPRDRRNQAIFELFYSTGIRLSELCNLTVQDVDLRHLAVRVNLGKGGKDRVIPLGKTAGSALYAYLADQPDTHRSRWLFPGRKPGAHIHIATVGTLVKDSGHNATLRTSISPHGFRHACASHMMQAGASIMHIQQLLGHASPSTTQIYLRVTCTDMRKTLAQCHPRERQSHVLKRLITQLSEPA